MILLLALACNADKEPDTGGPSTDGEPPPLGEEIYGDGLDEDGDGWADEYGEGGIPDVRGPQIGGSFDTVAVETLGSTGWMVAAQPGTDARGRTVTTWFDVGYGAPSELQTESGEERFGLSVALTGPWLAVTGTQADGGFAVYTLPPVQPAALVPGVTLGERLLGADLGPDGGDALLVSDGPASTLVYTGPWTEPSTPGGWSGGVAGGAGDVDGDGLSEVLLAASAQPSDGGSAWVVDAAVSGVVPVGEVGREIAPSGGVTWEGPPVPAGDVDGDGYGDLLVPAAGADLRGEVQLLQGPIEGPTGPDLATVVVEGTWEGEECTRASVVGGALAVGCPGADLPGRVAIFLLDGLAGRHPAEDADATWVGASVERPLGVALAGGVDLTGDLEPDLAAIGAELTLIPGPLGP